MGAMLLPVIVHGCWTWFSHFMGNNKI